MTAVLTAMQISKLMSNIRLICTIYYSVVKETEGTEKGVLPLFRSISKDTSLPFIYGYCYLVTVVTLSSDATWAVP